MKCLKAISIWCIAMIWLPLIGQSNLMNTDQQTNLPTGNPEWFNNLYTPGIDVQNDTLILSAEVQHLLAHPEEMQKLFPEQYKWEDAIAMMQSMDLKKAFWHLINLYPDNKEMVMKTMISYDQVLKMDDALVSSFYTYSMLDPNVCEFKNGKPNVVRPDLVEAKLGQVKEMVDYLVYYRTLK